MPTSTSRAVSGWLVKPWGAVRAWGMGEIAVRLLDEDGWQDYRDMRLAALRESAQAFLATYAEEAMQPEQYWRHCMVRARSVARRE